MSSLRKIGQDIDKATDAEALDSALKGTKIPGNTSIPAENYKGVSPDVQVSVDRTTGFSSQVAASNVTPNNGDNNSTARPANKIDLARLDESMIMDMPFIQAKTFDVAALLHVKPKDPEIRFRWVNWKNNDGSNHQMFKSIGFKDAVLEDVDMKVTPIGDNNIKEDGTIKYFDVVLMKVNVIRLMQAYKANIQRSLQMVGRWSDNARKEAERTFRNDVSPDILSAMKKQGLSVDFYAPSQSELDKDEKDMASGKFQSVV